MWMGFSAGQQSRVMQGASFTDMLGNVSYFQKSLFLFHFTFFGSFTLFYIYSAVLLSTGVVNRQNPYLCGTSTVARKMENKQLKKVNYMDMLESLPTVTVAMKLKDDPWKHCYSKSRQHIKQRHYIANKGPYNQSYGFFSSHVRM